MRIAFPRRCSRWTLRVRLTVGVTSITAVMLAATGALVYGQFARDLDRRTDSELRERATTVVDLSARVTPDQLVALSGEPLVQVYRGDGQVIASSRSLDGTALLTPARVVAARRAPLVTDIRPVRGTDDGVRARAVAIRGGGVALIAEDLDRREQDLARLGLLLAVALPGALLIAGLTGYHVAGAALRPVERIRAQAERIKETDLSQRLVSPGTGDELDRLSTTLNDLLERLSGAVERERRIVSDASHELRTPISVLRARLEVARRADHDADGLRMVIDEATDDVRRLSRLADDLLLLARADQGRLPVRPEPLDVQDLVDDAVGRHHAVATKLGRDIEAAVEITGGAVVLADPDRVAQVLDNLIVNALRHGRGRVRVTAHAPESSTVAITVTDEGDGFPADMLKGAFERFRQGDHDRRDHGAGLGLAIVAALVHAHGGAVRAVNGPNDSGAEVTVTLPAA